MLWLKVVLLAVEQRFAGWVLWWDWEEMQIEHALIAAYGEVVEWWGGENAD